MQKSRFNEDQIVAVLKEADAGVPIGELCRRLGVSEGTFYRWKKKYGGLEENKKVVGPQARREAVRVACAEGKLSQLRAYGLVGIARGSVLYERRQRDDRALRARKKELAANRPRFGYRRLHVLLRREKKEDGTMRWQVNQKRVYRLYREEGLAMRRKAKKRLRSEARTPLDLPIRMNQVWTMDSTHDSMANGGKFRTLNLMDGYCQELEWYVCWNDSNRNVGMTAKIIVDNGPEFLSRVVDQWAYENGVEFHFIEPGKPTQDAYIESFNGKFRDECLNQNWFLNLNVNSL
jgi:putative transposase